MCGLIGAAALVAITASADQPASDEVGLIEGQDIAVTGPMSVEVVGTQVKTVLRSGADVRVKSGQARLSLVEGGQISICGPAHFSVLKAGGALTVALESGTIHARVADAPALTVYTAQIQAQTIAIGNEPREILAGFENPGVMCLKTYRGAVRVEQQLSGQSVIVPQGEDVLLTNGQIDAMGNGAGHCECDLQMTKAMPMPRLGGESTEATGAKTQDAAGEASEAEPVAGSAASKTEPTESQGEPIYQVDMPPLRFDANARVQPAPDPALMAIVRTVRVRPALVFRGEVEEAPKAKPEAALAAPAASSAPKAASKSEAQQSMTQRVRAYFRHLWSRSG
ncbi:MAG TPA: hypothetical protein VJN93_11985 [Candidatus Acidoferrum sp.]|nr:hypothetical protein [Candidatus Acidoferrum sp.]